MSTTRERKRKKKTKTKRTERSSREGGGSERAKSNESICVCYVERTSSEYDESTTRSEANCQAEFDKQTSLGVKTEFPKAMSSAPFIVGSIAKDICSQMACEVLSRVPQIVDYTCTICTHASPAGLRYVLDLTHPYRLIWYVETDHDG